MSWEVNSLILKLDQGNVKCKKNFIEKHAKNVYYKLLQIRSLFKLEN